MNQLLDMLDVAVRNKPRHMALCRYVKWYLVVALYVGATSSEAGTAPVEQAPAGGLTDDQARSVTVEADRWERPWQSLDADQKARVRASMAGLRSQDEPPYPVEGLVAVLRAVGSVQRPPDFTDDLVIRLEVDADGRVAHAAVPRQSRPLVERYVHRVAAVLSQVTFKPGLCDGAPCAMTFPLRIPGPRRRQ